MHTIIWTVRSLISIYACNNNRTASTYLLRDETIEGLLGKRIGNVNCYQALAENEKIHRI